MNRSAELQLRQDEWAGTSALATSWSSALQFCSENHWELRGAGLLAAWLGWFDSRFENTRLKIIQTDGRGELAHYFSDLGGGLGRGTGFFSPRGESPDEFAWTFTRARIAPDGRRSFSIVGFKPIDATPAFEQMTIDDARWMARLIGQLSEQQIVEAMAASGFDSGAVRTYTEKLISRRDQMIRDLGLDEEIGPLRQNGSEEGTLTIRTEGGNETAKRSDRIGNRKAFTAEKSYGTPTTR